MLENILMGKGGGSTYQGAPLLGYNFDKLRSVGKIVTTADQALSNRVDFGVGGELPDYVGGMRLLNRVCSMGPANGVQAIGTGDFTVELYFWMSAYPNTYIQIFNLRTKHGMMYIGFTDAGWGYRMHIGVMDVSQALVNNAYYIAPFRQQDATNKWHHVALVRKAGKVTAYIDGVQQLLAVGPGSYNYAFSEFASSDVFDDITTFQFGGTTAPTDLYYPEVLIYDVAKYTKSFTPPKGPIAPLS